MSNDSSTSGFVTPTSTSQLAGDALTDFFSALVNGITGLPTGLVRPRWQPEAPDIPAFGVDWCGIGVTHRDQDTFAAEIHHAAGNGYSEMRRHAVLTILASFYGPSGDANAQLLADGLQIAQNREVLQGNKMGLVDSGEVITTPAFLKDRWTYRYDVQFRVKQQTVRTYNILSLVEADGTISIDTPPLTVEFSQEG